MYLGGGKDIFLFYPYQKEKEKQETKGFVYISK